MKFKTNAKCQNCVAAITKEIHQKFPNAALNFDLENADKVLEIHGIPEDSEHARQIEDAISEAGFTGAWIQDGQVQSEY